MFGGEWTADRDSGDLPAPRDDPYPDWGFDEVDPEIPTPPGELDGGDSSFPYSRFGRVDADGTVLVDAYTPEVDSHYLAVADPDGNALRSTERQGADGTATFDLSGAGDGVRLTPGTYAVVNAELTPRALQPLCVQGYEATLTEVTSDPVPSVTVTVDALVEDPPETGVVGLFVWNETTATTVELTETGDVFEGDLSGVDPGSYSVHAFVLAAGTDEQVVGLSGVDSAAVVPQTDLSLAVDGQADSVALDYGETAPYTATAVFEDGGTDDVTDEVTVAATAGDPATVDIDETAAEVTGAAPGTVTLEAEDGSFTDTVEVSVGDPSQVGVVLRVDGRSESVAVDEGETAPYTAAAVFEDGSEQPITDEVTVTVADGDPATVDIDETTAEVTGAAPGTVTLETGDGGFTDTVEVNVGAPSQVGLTVAVDGGSESVVVDECETVPYTATAVFEDGSTADVTDDVSVSVTDGDPGVVAIDETAAEVTGSTPGAVTLRADDDGITDTVDVTVEAPSQTGLTLTVDGGSDTVTVEEGKTVPYTVTALFEDDSTADVTDEATVTVTAGDPGAVAIDADTAAVTGVDLGTATLAATDSGFTDTVAVTVAEQYPDWGFDEITPEIQTPPGDLDRDGTSFPYDRFGRADPGGLVFVDAYSPDIDSHYLGIVDESGDPLRGAEVDGSDSYAEFDLSGAGDGDRVDPGTYAVLNTDGNLDPRALQPLCVQGYEATLAEVTADPVPSVTVTVDTLVEDPPEMGVVGLFVWNETTATTVELTETGGAFEGSLSGVDPGSYSVHAFVLAAGTDEQVVGLSGVDSAAVAAPTELTLVVDGESESTVLSEGETAPYTATAVFGDGTTEDVTDEVAVNVSIGDPATVGIDESAAEVTGAAVGTVTLEASDGERTDSVGVTVESGPQAVEFEVDGQSGGVTLQAGETAPYSVTAVFGDGEETVTGTAEVTSATPGVVSVDQTAAEVIAEAPGETVPVTATYEGETDTVDVTVPSEAELGVTLSDETAPPGGTAQFTVPASAVETVTLDGLWTDWTVDAAAPDGAETTDSVDSTGQFELSWGTEQASVAPTVSVTLPDRYVGGAYRLSVTATGGDGSTVTDAATLTVTDSA